MDVMEAIRGRRTIHQFSARPVDREQVEAILEAAVWAPNHKLTNPWEFYVVSGERKEQLARLRGELKRNAHAAPDSPAARAQYEKAYIGLATVPYAILVCQRLAEDGVRRDEDHLSMGCAVQNAMLAAHSMGLGTFWGSGPLINHPETFRLLGVPEGRRAIGLIFLGYPEEEPAKAPPRAPLAERVRWLS